MLGNLSRKPHQILISSCYSVNMIMKRNYYFSTRFNFFLDFFYFEKSILQMHRRLKIATNYVYTFISMISKFLYKQCWQYFSSLVYYHAWVSPSNGFYFAHDLINKSRKYFFSLEIIFFLSQTNFYSFTCIFIKCSFIPKLGAWSCF